MLLTTDCPHEHTTLAECMNLLLGALQRTGAISATYPLLQRLHEDVHAKVERLNDHLWATNEPMLRFLDAVARGANKKRDDLDQGNTPSSYLAVLAPPDWTLPVLDHYLREPPRNTARGVRRDNTVGRVGRRDSMGREHATRSLEDAYAKLSPPIPSKAVKAPSGCRLICLLMWFCRSDQLLDF